MRLNLLQLLLILIISSFFSACEYREPKKEPVACINLPTNEVNIGEPVQFISCSENATSHLWDFGDNNTKIGDVVNHSYQEAGSYIVTLTAYNEDLENNTQSTILVKESGNEDIDIVTKTISNIGMSTASSGGIISYSGPNEIIERGVCWNTEPNPTIYNTYTINGNGDGGFDSELINLNFGTTYYVRAYATLSTGTYYGNELEFTTLTEASVPEINTLDVSDITVNSAICGGEIVSDGGSEILGSGICWSTSTSPTIDDYEINANVTMGEFAIIMEDLMPSTTYYVRAYASNAMGTGYGNQVQFITNGQENEGEAVAYKMKISVDGVVEEEWDNANRYDISKVFKGESFDGEEDLSAYWKACWNENGVFILVEVTADDFHYTDPEFGESWEKDYIEIYFDMNVDNLQDGVGPEIFGEGHYQLSALAEEEAYLEDWFTGARAFVLKNDNSYIQEVFIPWSNFSEGFYPDGTTVIGFDVTIADNDGEENGMPRNRKVWVNDGNGPTGQENWFNMDDAGTLLFME